MECLLQYTSLKHSTEMQKKNAKLTIMSTKTLIFFSPNRLKLKAFTKDSILRKVLRFKYFTRIIYKKNQTHQPCFIWVTPIVHYANIHPKNKYPLTYKNFAKKSPRSLKNNCIVIEPTHHIRPNKNLTSIKHRAKSSMKHE